MSEINRYPDYDECSECGADNGYCMCLALEDSCEYCGADPNSCFCDYIDCGLGPDGQCSKAGSEECDWECGALRNL